MSHNPEQLGYFDTEKEARIARKVHQAMKWEPECKCEPCEWMGQWDEATRHVLYHETTMDPEVIEYLCPFCGEEVGAMT
jgi:Zn finger protein HypA/HybF involved in hydrogenase expression